MNKIELLEKVSELSNSKAMLSNEKIISLCGEKEHSCSCKDCRDMCMHIPCLGTPSDIKKIIDAGYGDKLSPTTWMAGTVVTGGVVHPIEMIQITANDNGSCPFFEEGKCLLHDKNLKPLEGRLASHEIEPVTLPLRGLEDFSKILLSSVFLVAVSWKSEGNMEDACCCVEHLLSR